MQSVFFLSLFSLMFFMFSGLTAGLGKSIMELNEERSENVEVLFSDIETVLNKVVFGVKDSAGDGIVELTDSNITDLSGDFLPSHVGFAKRQIENDPWGNKIHLLKDTEQVVIWGDSGVQIVKAPITTFLLISAGPNERYDFLTYNSANVVNPVLSSAQIKTTDISSKNRIGDDIIRRFNNYEPMLNMWQRAENLDFMIKSVALDYYKGLVDAFYPLIQLAQRDVRKAGVLKENVFDNLEDEGGSYGAFNNLGDENSELLANSWYEDDPNDPDDIHDILYNNFKDGKVYNNEFQLFDITISGGSDENEDLNEEFIDKYRVPPLPVGTGTPREFIYPTFDVLDNTSVENGLKNLGITNLKTLDPFSDINGSVTYTYDPNDPAKITIKREKLDTDSDKWYINKEVVIDALGG
ncbi:MAG: hypothetical protein GY793_09455 [Proteobacteria bacterium]|nr:hypothetical protein [Pseudomonadota bacterium]